MLYDYILKAKMPSILIIYQEKHNIKLDIKSKFNFLFFN